MTVNMDKYEKRKLKLYGLFWLAVFVIPTIPLLWGAMGITGHYSSSEEITSLWTSLLPFLVLFLIHNFIILPLRKKSSEIYVIAVLVLVTAFGYYCFMDGNQPPGHHDIGMERMERMERMDHMGTPPPPPSHRPARPAAILLGCGVLAIIANLGVNAIVENERKEEDRRHLEIENLKLQLASLRYQINPHFFLNTLNNIQALILIDPDKATKSIGIFSKLTQMILRGGNSPVVPLADEVSCLEYFIDLMRLRYTDNVKIETSFPQNTGNAFIQPLILGTFVENAFKHGISYDHPSFIRIKIEIQDGRIIFICENSIHSEALAESHGIGLENARKRLSLLYGDKLSLHADSYGDHYSVKLIVPDKIEIPE